MEIKTRYTIHDVAALLGISPDAIRLYEKEGLVFPLRDPNNGYRYYEFAQIHRILGISLYRQLGVGIAEIRELLSGRSFDELCDHFDSMIELNERKIEQLQQQTEKMRFMKTHLENLNKGYETYSIRQLPDAYVVYHQEHALLLYKEIKTLFQSPVFSFGNFCYHLQKEENEKYQSQTLEFIIQKKMLELSPWKNAAESFPVQKGSRCLYTVKTSPGHAAWDLSDMEQYAKENGLRCKKYAYAFFVYSMLQEETIQDYYEIYIPLVELY